MELLYVWVESYGNIKRQGFNFSSNYWFEVDENNNLLDKTEERKKNGKLNEQPEKFFGDNISNITAIVGKNGSGKSTLLNAIMSMEFNGVIIFKLDNGERRVYYSEKIKIVNSLGDYKPYSYEIAKDSGCLLPSNTDLKNISEKIKNVKTDNNKMIPLYFDNIFNAEKNHLFMCYNFYSYSMIGNIDDNISTNHEFFVNNYKDELKYVSNETKNFIKFLKLNILPKGKDEKEFIRIPKKLYIRNKNISEVKVTYEKIKCFMKTFVFNMIILFIEKNCEPNRDYDIYIKSPLSVIKDFLAPKNEIEKKEQESIKNIKEKVESEISEIVNEILKLKSFDYNSIFKVLNEGIVVDNLKVGRNYFVPSSPIDLKTMNKVEEKPLIDKYIHIIIAVQEFYNKCKDDSIVCKENEEELELNFSSLDTNVISNLLESIKGNSIQEHFFIYDFDIKFSSGEKGLLTLFSRVLNKKEKILDITNKTVLFLLDEPDIFAHPEWQRKLINNLKIGLERIFDNKKIFQIILTSHSPFVTSDLPR